MKYILILVLFLFGCASVQTLDGGDKDIFPPKVLNISPDSASLNINSKEFIFKFDEYIKTTKVSDLLIISPRQILNPELKIKGKKLFLNLKNDLLPNTTYTIQFNGSIIDVNESNPLTEYTYVFSTGNYLDSLSIQGIVKHSETKKVCQDCNVHLYKAQNDSIVLKQKPLYTTKTNGQGSYKFYNLPDDTFKLIAIQDLNKNLLLDPDEQISLYKIKDSKSQDSDTLSVFPLPNTKKLKPEIITPLTPGIIKLKLNNTIDTSTSELLINESKVSYTLSQTLDTILALYTPTKDTTQLSLIHKTDTSILDYILPLGNLKYRPKPKFSISKGTLSLKANTLIASIDTSKFTLSADSNITKLNRYYLSNTDAKIFFNKNKLPNKLIIQEGAITDVFGNLSKTDTLSLQIPEIKNTLIIDYQIDKSSYYLIYLTKNNRHIRLDKINQSKKITYTNLKIGEYEIKIIKDLNQNGIWDTGDLFKNKQAEPIQLSQPFEILDNWDKELIIKVL